MNFRDFLGWPVRWQCARLFLDRGFVAIALVLGGSDDVGLVRVRNVWLTQGKRCLESLSLPTTSVCDSRRLNILEHVNIFEKIDA